REILVPAEHLHILQYARNNAAVSLSTEFSLTSRFCLADPDIDPSWYTGRGIRPVGRFGRRRAAAENVQKSGNRHLHACFPVEESNESLQDE
uniref:Prolactin releasing hormone n=1 Tax=Naja naja TaxID=35670 RepID=A0A8C7E2T9_NAJNA